VLAVFFVPLFYVIVRRFFKGSERQRRMYAHETENSNLHTPEEDR
jgi:multidrug efflux pump